MPLPSALSADTVLRPSRARPRGLARHFDVSSGRVNRSILLFLKIKAAKTKFKERKTLSILDSPPATSGGASQSEVLLSALLCSAG